MSGVARRPGIRYGVIGRRITWVEVDNNNINNNNSNAKFNSNKNTKDQIHGDLPEDCNYHELYDNVDNRNNKPNIRNSNKNTKYMATDQILSGRS